MRFKAALERSKPSSMLILPFILLLSCSLASADEDNLSKWDSLFDRFERVDTPPEVLGDDQARLASCNVTTEEPLYLTKILCIGHIGDLNSVTTLEGSLARSGVRLENIDLTLRPRRHRSAKVRGFPREACILYQYVVYPTEKRLEMHRFPIVKYRDKDPSNECQEAWLWYYLGNNALEESERTSCYEKARSLCTNDQELVLALDLLTAPVEKVTIAAEQSSRPADDEPEFDRLSLTFLAHLARLHLRQGSRFCIP